MFNAQAYLTVILSKLLVLSLKHILGKHLVYILKHIKLQYLSFFSLASL